MSSPWDDLEPSATPGRAETPPGHPGPEHRTPGGFTVFLRGATKRCPRCGSGKLFKSWFKIRERCPRCGLRLEREEGGFLGAMTLNYLFTAVVWLVVLVVWLAMDLPDLHVPALTITSIAIAALVPAAVLAVLEDDLGERRLPDLPDEPRLRITGGRRSRQRQRRPSLTYSRQGSRMPRSEATASASS